MDNIYDRTGRIFDIQRYSIHDGPGIRTIIFFKGCFLRCRWCCNPESQEYAIQTMTQGGKVKTVGRDVTVRELMDEATRDIIYFNRSGGGITLSGGECLAQPDFCEAVLRATHEAGINTAIETTAFAKRAVLERIVPHVDYVLMDIKHMNPTKHRLFTGQTNEVILDNARWMAKNSKSLTIRTPVVPGFNDTREDIAAIARFASSLGGATKGLHLLPYHRLGQDKYTGLGRDYTLRDILPPEKDKMEELLATAHSVAPSLHVQIGG